MKHKYKLIKSTRLIALKAMVVISALVAGFIGYMAGQTVEYNRANLQRIAFNKEVKHQEYFMRWKLGELRRWETTIKKDEIKTARVKP